MKQQYTTFEAYLDDELSAEERQDFERQLLADPSLKKEFEEYAAMRQRYRHSLANEAADEKLRASLEDLGREFFPPSRQPKAPRRIWLLVTGLAAACVILMMLFYRPKDLFHQYFQPPLAAFTEKGNGEAGLLQQAERAFNAGDYARAGQYFDAVLTENPGDLQATFYRGLSHLGAGDPAAARGMLEPLALGASAFAEDAQWFLALSYLREKDYAACRSELANIPQNSRWWEKAEALKQSLEKRSERQ